MSEKIRGELMGFLNWRDLNEQPIKNILVVFPFDNVMCFGGKY
jgi:hypothetical protein